MPWYSARTHSRLDKSHNLKYGMSEFGETFTVNGDVREVMDMTLIQQVSEIIFTRLVTKCTYLMR